MYFRKLHVLRASSSGKGMGHSAKRQAQRADDAAPVGAPTTTRDEHEPAAAMNVEAAGGLPAGDDAPGGATGAEQLAPRRRRRAKSEAQVRKGLERLARKHYERFVLRCIAATKRLGSPRVLFTVIRFCGRLMQLIQGDVSLRLRLREERDAWRDVHVVDGPIRYHRLWRGSLMETTESDRGAVVAGLAAAPMRCVAASSDGASASSLFEDPEGMLAVATMIPVGLTLCGFRLRRRDWRRGLHTSARCGTSGLARAVDGRYHGQTRWRRRVRREG